MCSQFHFFFNLWFLSPQACRQRGIKYLVAPFEADAQLEYLNKKGYADVVITEDSDLLMFGCTQVIYYCVVW